MRQILIAAAIAAMTFAGTLTTPAPVVAAEASADKKADSDVAEIRKLFADYARLMNEKDPEAIAEKIYGIAAIYHQPNGEHVAYTDTASLALTWKRYIDAIEAKQGAVKLDINDVQPCLLNSFSIKAAACPSALCPALHAFDIGKPIWRRAIAL